MARKKMIKYFLPVLLFMSTSVYAQEFESWEYINPCNLNPDVLTIRDDGPNRAIVTYYNSDSFCSTAFDEEILVSENGIEVSILITAGGLEAEYRESIFLQPIDIQLFAYPAEGSLFDGETREFIIMGGLS